MMLRVVVPCFLASVVLGTSNEAKFSMKADYCKFKCTDLWSQNHCEEQGFCWHGANSSGCVECDGGCTNSKCTCRTDNAERGLCQGDNECLAGCDDNCLQFEFGSGIRDYFESVSDECSVCTKATLKDNTGSNHCRSKWRNCCETLSEMRQLNNLSGCQTAKDEDNNSICQEIAEDK